MGGTTPHRPFMYTRMTCHWDEARAAAHMQHAPWQEVDAFLYEMHIAACISPCQVGALRRLVQTYLFPRVRCAAAAAACPTPPFLTRIIARLQTWLVMGILRSPVAVRGTGYFAAVAANCSLWHETPVPPSCVPVQNSDPCTCAVCGDKFDVQFDDALNTWVYTDAVRLCSSTLLHIECCQ